MPAWLIVVITDAVDCTADILETPHPWLAATAGPWPSSCCAETRNFGADPAPEEHSEPLRPHAPGALLPTSKSPRTAILIRLAANLARHR